MRPIEMICINCPLGCQLTVSKEGDGELQVSGYSCKRGIDYAHNELENPMRTVTTTVRTESLKNPRVSVKGSSPIPVGEIFLFLERTDDYILNRACSCGEILITGICEDVDLIATQDYILDEEGDRR